MGRWLLGARRLHHGGRRQGGRRRGRFLRRDRIRYIRLSTRTKARLPPPARGTPERRTAIHAVDRAMLRPPPRPRARARTAPATKRIRRRRPSPPRNPRSVQIVRPPEGRPLKEGLDAGGVRRHRHPRRARCSTRAPRRLGGQDPSLHLLQPAHITSSMPLMATTLQDDQGFRSSSEFRGTRRAPTRVRLEAHELRIC